MTAESANDRYTALSEPARKTPLSVSIPSFMTCFLSYRGNIFSISPVCASKEAKKGYTLLINALVSTGELKEIEEYDVDFDHQFLETEKYDAKPSSEEESCREQWTYQ